MQGSGPRRRPLLIAAVVGSVWGLFAYVILWGFTPIVVQRAFVVGPVGTALLLPIRLVLWLIHTAEKAAGRPFELSENHWWIGIVSGLAGSAIVLAAVIVFRLIRRAAGGGPQAGSESRSLPSASERSR
ncbi:MAG: hypothetical protein ACRDH9_05315 [Actinomycetota bacterium]